MLRALIAMLMVCGAAFAQERYPAKPLQIIVPFSPGTATDILARLLLALGVSTLEPMRSPLEVPSAREAGVDYDFNAWFGLLAPAKTPPAIVELLARSVREVIDSSVLAEEYREVGLAPRIVTLADFDAYVRADTDKQGVLVRASGAKAD